MEDWRPEFVPAVDSIPSALLWVRLPSLPLEFWSDSVLAAILEPAGQFLCSDPATRALSRGAFARACVRVDLRQPLRPGVRVQGMASPFWQQFQFEHLTGICPCCGSIHLAGPCSMASPSSEADRSSPTSLFGPWMTATHQRKVPATVRKQPASDAGTSSVATEQPSSSVERSASAMEGWVVPAKSKSARRRSLRSGTSDGGAVVAPSHLPDGSSQGLGSSGGFCAGAAAVPVVSQCADLTVALRPGLQLATYVKQNSDSQAEVSLNPFALLGANNGDSKPKSRSDVNPGPSKRARPEETITQRAASKDGKRKGKGIIATSTVRKEKVTPAKSVIISKEPASVSARSDLAPASQLSDGGVTKGKSALSNDRSHDPILSRLKLAIKDQFLDSTLPSNAFQGTNPAFGAGPRENVNSQMDCTSQADGDGTRPAESFSNMAMVEDQGGIHPPHN